MDFRTEIEITRWSTSIDYQEGIQLYGSCFAENIGLRMNSARMKVDVNPTGILYNPLSVYDSIRRISSGSLMNEVELVARDELFHSMSHHSVFSGNDRRSVIEKINQRIVSSHHFLSHSDWVIVTWGSAFVYEFSNLFPSDNPSLRGVVANCHKFPERMFNRRMLSVSEIVDKWMELLSVELLNKKVILTVSPIRHRRDGLHQNQLSKSTLLLAANQLVEQCPNVSYFPSYEIMLDDLRDYRFYNSDMIHPSDVAIDYIWKKFTNACLTENCRHAIEDWERIRRGLEHRPRNPHSEAYQTFLQTLDKEKKQFENKHGL